MTRLEVIETLDYLREHSISHVYAECLDIAARALREMGDGPNKEEMKTVSNRKLDAILGREVSFNQCPKCGQPSINIVIALHWYGRNGARAICQNCGTATKIYKISEAFCNDGGRLATPITSKGIIRGIYNALKEWQGLSAE